MFPEEAHARANAYKVTLSAPENNRNNYKYLFINKVLLFYKSVI